MVLLANLFVSSFTGQSEALSMLLADYFMRSILQQQIEIIMYNEMV